MNYYKKLTLALAIFAAIICEAFKTTSASAVSLSVSPMYQNVSLVPGETYYGSFKITNPDYNSGDYKYMLYTNSFSADNDNEISFENNGDYNKIVDWINLESDEGSIAPNATKEIHFSIVVPEDAPAGGQYAAIMVRQEALNAIDGAVNLQQNFEISHLIYADVAGETVRKGDIADVNVPGFLFSGKITGNSKITNLGNVHSRATQTMQVFPLFSNEEVFTNEENPDTVFIMPGNTRLGALTWEETPTVGIFHVIYNVEYEGVNSNVDKLVIVCPLWLLFIIILAIFLIIFKIWNGKKREKK